MQCERLAFPLNVYAWVLKEEEGRVDYLHYGLFDERHRSATEAQRASTELILARLPAPPCRVLEVGIGLGTTARELANSGYAVTGITPDPEQIAIARRRVGSAVPLHGIRFEDYDAPAGSVDIVLFQESAQYINSLDLLNKAYHLLADQGEVFILDEVALRRTDTYATELPLLGHLLAQAERCGFEAVERIDLSVHAKPSVDYLLRSIRQHRRALADRLALDDEAIEQLLSALSAYQDRYEKGEYGYVLIRLRKAAPPRWRVTTCRPSDANSVRVLFYEVFAQPMSEALWQWKYGDGRGMATLGWLDGSLVAHYGGSVRRVMLKGTETKAVQICDVMVRPKERGAFTRRGPFFLTAATFPELWVGYGADYPIGFGFPNARAMRVAERLGLYAEVAKMVEVRWPTAAGRPRLATRVRHLNREWIRRDREHADALWRQMRDDLKDGIISVRDADYLTHRYLAHPEQRYEVLLVYNRFGGRPRGIVVMRKERERYLLLDLVGPLKSIPVLIAQARRLAGNWNGAELTTWMTERFAQSLAGESGQVHPLDVRIPTSIWTPGPAPASLRDAWWLMSGDTDFL